MSTETMTAAAATTTFGGRPEVWMSPTEIRELRETLGLDVEEAAARVAAACEFGRPGPRRMARAIRDIESGDNCLVSREVADAIRRGLGLRSINGKMRVEPRRVLGALNRSGLSLDEACARITEYALQTDDPAGAAAAAEYLTAMSSNGTPFVARCAVGKNVFAGLDMHAEAKHGGSVRDHCSKCMSKLVEAEAHVDGCHECQAHLQWVEQREAQRGTRSIPMPAARALALVLGRSLHELSSSTAHQRRQLYGVSAA